MVMDKTLVVMAVIVIILTIAAISITSSFEPTRKNLLCSLYNLTDGCTDDQIHQASLMQDYKKALNQTNVGGQN